MVGTDRLESCENRTRIFQGRRKRTGRRPSRGALQVPFPYLRTSRFHGHGPLRRRENSSRGSRRRLRARLRHRGFARGAVRRHRSSVDTPGPSPSPGSGILTRFPFDGRPAARFIRSGMLNSRFVFTYGSGAFREDFRPRLRTD